MPENDLLSLALKIFTPGFTTVCFCNYVQNLIGITDNNLLNAFNTIYPNV